MGTTTTPAEIHTTIIAALATQARDCRKAASGHRNGGPHMAGARAALRAEAQRCEDLARILAYVAPEALAAVLEARPSTTPEAIEFTSDSRLVKTAPCTQPEYHGAGLLGGKPNMPVLCDRPEHHEPASVTAAEQPEYPAVGSAIPPEKNGGQAGYVVGECGHRVAGSEWRAGFRRCERCGTGDFDDDDEPRPIEDDEQCPRCHAVNWGMTPDGRNECVSCQWTAPVVAADDEPASPEERLLLVIYGVNPDSAGNVRELRTHAAECTEDDHTYCLAHLAEQAAGTWRRVTGQEA